MSEGLVSDARSVMNSLVTQLNRVQGFSTVSVEVEQSREQRRSRRQERRRQRARIELVDAARAVMRTEGLAGLTVDAVAERVGLSKAGVYYYFADKEALLRALLVADQLDVVARLVGAVDGAPGGPAVLGVFVRAVVAAYLDDLETYRLQQLWPQIIGMEPGDMESAVNPAVMALFDRLEARLREGPVRDGVDPRRTVFVAWTSALGLLQTLALLEALGTGTTHGVDDLVDTLARSVVRGAQPD